MGTGEVERGGVIVTGAAGYLGSVVVPTLSALGWRVTGIDAHWFSSPTPGRGVEHRDIRDAEADWFRGSSAVVHLAGVATAAMADRVGDVAWQINHVATLRLAEAALQMGARRFVFASSSALYGTTVGVADEDAPILGDSLYCRTKAAAERDLLAMAERGLEPVILRLGTVYGCAPAMRIDSAIHRMTADAVQRGSVAVHSDGSSYRPFVHVDDVAEAIEAVVSAPSDAVAGRVFNLAHPDDNLRMNEVAALIGRIVPGSVVKPPLGVVTDHLSYRVSSDAIGTALGFRPRKRLVDGIAELAALFAEVRPPGEGEHPHRLRTLEAQLTAGTLGGDLRPPFSKELSA